MVDEDDRILLIQLADGGDAPLIWITPGGGLNPGEAPEDALRREVREELGADLGSVAGPVWRRRHQFVFGGRNYDQTEAFYLCRVANFEPEFGGLEPHEVIVAHRWWTLADLAAHEGLVAPRRLAHFLGRLLAEGAPSEPIDVGV